MVRVEMKISTQFWAGKRVLLTGHTGFKGAWLALWLHRLGAHVTGISLAPITTPNLFSLADIGSTIESYFCDIRDAEKSIGVVDYKLTKKQLQGRNFSRSLYIVK